MRIRHAGHKLLRLVLRENVAALGNQMGVILPRLGDDEISGRGMKVLILRYQESKRTTIESNELPQRALFKKKPLEMICDEDLEGASMREVAQPSS